MTTDAMIEAKEVVPNRAVQRRRRPPIEIIGNIALVPLTHGKYSTIDVSDVHLVEGNIWYAYVSHGNEYARTNVTFADGRRTTIEMQRIIMKDQIRIDGRPKICIDHINMNGLDNRKENLRLATIQENARHTRCRSTSGTGVKGVYYRPGRSKIGPYSSQIAVHGRQIHIGYFATIDEAKSAYEAASIKYHGDFGCTHFRPLPSPPEGEK